MTCAVIHDELSGGLTAAEHRYRAALHGDNNIRVDVKSYGKLFVEEVSGIAHTIQHARTPLTHKHTHTLHTHTLTRTHTSHTHAGLTHAWRTRIHVSHARTLHMCTHTSPTHAHFTDADTPQKHAHLQHTEIQ